MAPDLTPAGRHGESSVQCRVHDPGCIGVAEDAMPWCRFSGGWPSPLAVYVMKEVFPTCTMRGSCKCRKKRTWSVGPRPGRFLGCCRPVPYQADQAYQAEQARLTHLDVLLKLRVGGLEEYRGAERPRRVAVVPKLDSGEKAGV